MDGGRLDALLAQVLDQAVGAALGAHEEERLLLARQMAAATFTLSIWCTWRNRCSMRVTVWVADATSWKTGSVR